MASGHAPRPKRVPTGSRAAANRQAIMAAARDVFMIDGFDASMDAVAAAAGVSKVTLYNHFAGKEELFVAVIDAELEQALEPSLQLVRSRLAESTDVRADLAAACRAWAGGLAAPRMIALRNLVAGELRRFPALGDTWQQRGPQRFHPVIADALRRLVRRRLLTIADVDLAVLQLSGLVVSPNLVYGAYGHPLDNRTTDRLVTAGVDMFIDHYRYRPRQTRR